MTLSARPSARCLAVAFAGLFTLTFSLGCASRGAPADANQKAVASLKQVNTELDHLDATVQAATDALRGLTPAAADLPAAFKSYGNAVADVEDAYEDAVGDWKDMQNRADAYIAAWQEQVAAVQDPALREAAQGRREAVSERFNDIADAARNAQPPFKPFLQQLQDLENVLGLDPSVAGVEATQGVIEQAIEQAQTVRSAIDDLRTQLMTLSTGLQATSPQS